MMRILVTGAGGNLGSLLVEKLADRHDVTGTVHSELEITDFAAVRDLMRDLTPDIVLHSAAWTDVDGCARDPERAIQINGYGAQNLAVAAAEQDAAILYISTNEVFDGQRSSPYHEYDAPAPINSYAYSKVVGERTVMALNPRHYIVRTAWLFAHGGKNFIQAILNAVEAGNTLRVVTDEVSNPTYTNDLADAVTALIETGRYGIYHLVNEGACSRYAFARYILDQSGHGDTSITPISSREWPRASIPPAYTALANQAAKMIGITLRPWQKAVDAFLEHEGVKTQ